MNTIDSPIYKCLKLDLQSNDQPKMVSLTSHGKSFLESEGIFVNQYGQKVKQKVKDDQDVESTDRQESPELKRVGVMITNAIDEYFKQPPEVCSKRGAKKAKRDLKNYVGQAWHGYLHGDRQKFADLHAKMLNLQDHGDQENFKIFSAIKEVMDDIPDAKKPGPSCW